MGWFAQKSDITADDMAASPNLGKLHVAGGSDGSHESGNPWIDHGAKCDGKDKSGDCFLADAVRGRLVDAIYRGVTTASTNYKIALSEVKLETLIEKDDDLNWVLSLALDVAGAHLLNVLGKTLLSVKAGGISKFTDVGLTAARTTGFDPKSASARAEQMLHAVSDKSITGLLKYGLDGGKKQVTKAARSVQNDDDHTEKTESLSYLHQLGRGCDEGFNEFADNAATNSNDAELLVVYRGISRGDYSVDAFEAALTAKLARYKASGTAKIGRHLEREHMDSDEFGTHSRLVEHNTRVVWVKDFSGNGKHLYLQSFPSNDAAVAPRIERMVPDEFHDLALARSEATWGPTPTIDPTGSYIHDAGFGKPADPRPALPPQQDPDHQKVMHSIFTGNDDEPTLDSLFAQGTK